jgi:plasmid maintenance system killer protein
VRVVLTDPFVESFTKAPPEVQKTFGKQLAMLLRNPRHPSLQAKKLEEKAERYSARVNEAWRFYYYREGDVYYLVDITAHPK